MKLKMYHPAVAAVFTELRMFEPTSRFCAAKSFLVFSQKKRENNLKTDYCLCLFAVKWNHTKVLGVYGASIALFLGTS